MPAEEAPTEERPSPPPRRPRRPPPRRSAATERAGRARVAAGRSQRGPTEGKGRRPAEAEAEAEREERAEGARGQQPLLPPCLRCRRLWASALHLRRRPGDSAGPRRSRPPGRRQLGGPGTGKVFRF